jgi:hypothetical protein
MGQGPSRDAVLTRTSSQPTRSTRSKHARRQKCSDDAGNTYGMPKLRREARTKAPSRHTKDNVRDPAPPPREFVSSTRRYHHHNQTRSAHRNDTTAPLSTSPTPKSRKQSQKQTKQTKECMVCTESRSLSRFSSYPPTKHCNHNLDVCRRCLRTWISTTFKTKIWNEIDCPTCSKRLDYEDMFHHASADIFHKYDKLCAKVAFEAIPGFHWCIMKGCRSGQVHGNASNKFCCVKCKRNHCIKHNTAWHKGETCREYDYRFVKSCSYRVFSSTDVT